MGLTLCRRFAYTGHQMIYINFCLVGFYHLHLKPHRRMWARSRLLYYILLIRR